MLARSWSYLQAATVLSMSDVISTQSGRVLTLTWSRPDALNAFNEDLYRLVTKHIRDAQDDPSVAVVVVTGEGRAFSAGQDMSEMADIGDTMADLAKADPAGVDAVSGFPGLVDALTEFTKPIVAAVNGIGVGLGFTFLAHCDLVFLSTEAKLRVPFCPLGVAPEAASSALFPEIMGWQNAAWVLLSGDWVSAKQALDMGIAWRLSPPEQVVTDAQAAAAHIAKWPIPSLVATKSAMLAGRADRVRLARKTEDAAFMKLMGTAANIEAVAAFLEKRDPDFTAIDGA